MTHATHYPHFTNAPGPVVVRLDGAPVSPPLMSGKAAFAWLIDHQGQSVHYALTYGGYSVTPA